MGALTGSTTTTTTTAAIGLANTAIGEGGILIVSLPGLSSPDGLPQPLLPRRNLSCAVALMLRAASKRRTLAYQRARATQMDVGLR